MRAIVAAVCFAGVLCFGASSAQPLQLDRARLDRARLAQEMTKVCYDMTLRREEAASLILKIGKSVNAVCACAGERLAFDVTEDEAANAARTTAGAALIMDMLLYQMRACLAIM